MVTKILRIDDDTTKNSLECFINNKGKIALQNPDDNDDGYNSFIITLDAEDALALSDELKRLLKLL